MKLMYHRQALDYIADHQGELFGRENVEIYASYLGSRPDNVDTLPDILSSYVLDFLLESRNEEVQGSTWRLLRSLARVSESHRNLGGQRLQTACITLAASVVESASAPLRITNNSDGAQAVAAPVLDRVAELLESPNNAIGVRMCELLTELAYHRPTRCRVSRGKCCDQLVFLLRDESLLVIERATYALYFITKLPEGMQAALEANLRDHVTELPKSLSHNRLNPRL
ncbi:hypothetical protein DFH09DRAFT_1287857 [Mycena vulgaris]|nr:hypothetical protein DFH09DRAFT_1287857 [Mycena vulgaris]